MPKISNTRKHKAAELLRLAQNGPSIDMKRFDGKHLTDAEYKAAYKNWSESWLLPLLRKLVPELREKKPE